MLRRGSLRRLTAAVLGGVLLAGAAACGSSGEDVDTEAVNAPAEITRVTVGVIPIVDVAPIFLGREKGFFRERGIDVQTTMAQGGAAIIPGVLKGDFQFGFSNVTSLMAAQAKKLPIKAVASGVASTGQPGLDFGAVVVNEDSPIKTAADLAGKTVAVNTLKNIAEVTARHSVRKAGGDPNRVKFVQMPFPQMPVALARKDVDAVMVVEPFLATVKGEGGRPVAWNYVDTAKDLTIAAWFTSNKQIQQDQDLVNRFTEAINESMRFANSHPDQVRSVLLSYMRIEESVLNSMTLPMWPPEINRESLDTLAKLSKDDQVFGKDEPNLDELLPAP